MGVVVDAQQAPSAPGLKGTEQEKPQLPTDLEQAPDLSPSSSKSAEQSEPSVSSASEPAPPPPRKPTFTVSKTVRAGGFVLGLCAGTVNAVAFQAIGSFVSHQTGSFSKVGLGNMDALGLVTSFVIGAVICGLLVSNNMLSVKLYDVCLIVQAGILVATTFLSDQPIAKFLAAAACGLQNAMATHWGGAVTRTTHVTGLFTDVGLLLGRLLSLFANKCGKQSEAFDTVTAIDDLNKLSVLGSIAVAYLVGIIVGVHSFLAIGKDAFLIPAAAVGLIGFMCFGKRLLGCCFSSVSSPSRMRMQRTWSLNQWNQKPAKSGPPKITRMGSSIV